LSTALLEREYDVIVIGGGPAGSTAATILAQHGRRVLVLEKDVFPRYHIGESLLPYCYFPLKRLGMVDKLNECGFVKKFSVQFVNVDGQQSVPFYFDTHMNHPAAQTWQVTRSKFDQMLLENARDHGAAVVQGVAVSKLIVENDTVVGVEVRLPEGGYREVRAPMTIDASGRDAVAINQFRWRVRDPYLDKMAIWTYWRNAKRDPGRDGGATTVAYVPFKGWFWYIPLENNITSVGIVAEKSYLFADSKDPKEIYHRQIQVNSWIADHVSVGEQFGKYYTTGEYSYRSRHCAMDGLVLIGDAFAFLDPVFSSGVFIALKSGEMAADVVHEALNDNDVSAARFSDYAEQLCSGIEAMRKLVYAFYDEAFSFGHFLKAHPEFRGDMTDCLIGHLFKDYDAMYAAVAKFAQVPAPLSHGRPQVCV